MRPLERELSRLVGEDAVRVDTRAYTHDSTEMQGLYGVPAAVVAPADVEGVQLLVDWCYRAGVPIVPRGGGTGFAGGAVPVEGGIVCSLECLTHVLQFEPHLWRARVEAGVTTATVHRLARENGLLYPPDPGASEQSQIGGNIACNAGGPHSFKYGVTSAWVSGVEAVIRNGDLVRAGGPLRKDVSGFDIRALMLGSEGTLGIITSAWLRFIPAPERAIPVIAAYASPQAGQQALLNVLANGLTSAVAEFFDGASIQLTRSNFPTPLSPRTEFLLITEADGTTSAAEALAAELSDVLSEDALDVFMLSSPAEARQLWRWRSGVSFAVSSHRGGKMSEDIVVPVERLADAIELTHTVGEQFRLPACSWGHAGDGNLHATFMVDASSPADVALALEASDRLFEGTRSLGGAVSGEHGLGWVKRSQFDLQHPGTSGELHRSVKEVFDPKNLFNPGKKLTDVRVGVEYTHEEER